MGRRPVPSEVRILAGTFRPDRHVAPEDQPKLQAMTVAPKPPRGLDKAGRDKWVETANLLMPLGLLTAADLDALRAYSEAWSEIVQCRKDIKKDGAYMTNSRGALTSHPALIRERAARDVMRRFQIEFGMTAASRAKVKVAGGKGSSSAVPVRKRG